MDSALKQRLLGAAVLIALAIIFVPMFLTSTPPKPENTTQNLNIPPAPERNFETRNLSVDAPKPGAPATPTPAPSPSPASGGDNNKVASVSTGAPSSFEAPDSATQPAPAEKSSIPAALAPTSSTPSAPAPSTAPSPPPPPATQTDGRFLVNLGVYADAGHASALVDKVKKLGYPAFSEATEFQGKSAQRVRVGPYADRAAAENVRLKIKQADAKVPSSIVQTGDADKPADKPAVDATKQTVAAKPAVAEPAATAPPLPANRAGAYAVQVGAFKSEDEANKVRDRLRNGGVAAYIEKSSDGDATFWRVRAGPYADRGGADTAVTTIKQKFQLPAIVKTQP